MSDFVNVKTILLDETEYIVLDQFQTKENEYYILSKENNPEEILVQKQIIKEKEEFLTDLDTKEELSMVYETFFSRHPEIKESFL